MVSHRKWNCNRISSFVCIHPVSRQKIHTKDAHVPQDAACDIQLLPNEHRRCKHPVHQLPECPVS